MEGTTVFLLDEFGDKIEKTKISALLQALSETVTGRVIISLHPQLIGYISTKEKEFNSYGYGCIQLGTVMRNTASIFGYYTVVSSALNSNVNTSTVLGKQVDYVKNTGDNFYSEVLDAVREKKFICFLPDFSQFDYSLLLAEIKLRNIPRFWYLEEKDKRNVEEE